MNIPTGQPLSATQLLEKLGNYVEQCYRELSAGHSIDLSGMDAEVAVLCEKVTQLPVEEAEALQPRMQELMEKLGGLGKKLEEARADVQKQLRDLNLQQKANKAYTTNPPPPQSAPPPPPTAVPVPPPPSMAAPVPPPPSTPAPFVAPPAPPPAPTTAPVPSPTMPPAPPPTAAPAPPPPTAPAGAPKPTMPAWPPHNPDDTQD